MTLQDFIEYFFISFSASVFIGYMLGSIKKYFDDLLGK